MANLHGKGNLNNLSKAMLLMNDAYKSALAEKKQVYADEFRLSHQTGQYSDETHLHKPVSSPPMQTCMHHSLTPCIR